VPFSQSPAASLAAVSCTPTKIVPTQTGLVNTLAAPASWPTPLEIQLTDDCGSPGPLAQTVDAPTVTLNSETVSFSFSGLTPGFAGLHQIDLQVPADAPNGDLNLVVNQPGFQGVR